MNTKIRKLEKSDKLVMIGDSTTDAGRAQPVGEGLFEALGRGDVCSGFWWRLLSFWVQDAYQTLVSEAP